MTETTNSGFKTENMKLVTPIGELHYVNISGRGKKNYNEDGFEYVASIRLEGDKAEALIDKIDECVEKMPKGYTLKSTSYKELVKDSEGKLRRPGLENPKKEDEEDTGIWEFLFKTNVTYANGNPKDIGVYNSKARKVSLGDKRVGNGTIGGISGSMVGSTNKKSYSVTLYLNSIQIVKFVEYEGDAGFEAQDEDYGDDAFEGVTDAESGFVGQPEDAAEEKKSPSKTKPKL